MKKKPKYLLVISALLVVVASFSLWKINKKFKITQTVNKSADLAVGHVSEQESQYKALAENLVASDLLGSL